MMQTVISNCIYICFIPSNLGVQITYHHLDVT
jgi:hypothetical protein